MYPVPYRYVLKHVLCVVVRCILCQTSVLKHMLSVLWCVVVRVLYDDCSRLEKLLPDCSACLIASLTKCICFGKLAKLSLEAMVLASNLAGEDHLGFIKLKA